ncbi:MAG: hypothetical protein HYR96_01845 [Deltaproteobacteria bacterium]|nr:hypothetical protein [Deltaproteobacteria bacterium]MBI3295809.1 hypothetical protein [Deltaproteobacteria bacterium]
MKKGILVLFPFVSTLAMAFVPGHYCGEGEWKTTASYTGTFTETIDIESCDGGFTIEARSKAFYNNRMVEDETRNTRAVNTGNGFFRVESNGQAVGTGFCYGSTCHMEFKTPGRLRQETFHFENGRLHQIGSYHGSSFDASWTGTLRD